MTIDIECECGETIEHDESETLYDEDYTPHKIVCPECGAIMNLCIHLEFVEEGKKSETAKCDCGGRCEQCDLALRHND